MKVSKESKIGITVVLAVAFLYWGIHYLRGINLFQPNNCYYVVYSNVEGLAKSAPVILDGFQVGVVEDMQYSFNKPGNIVVKMTLDKRLELPDGTQAILTPALIGSTCITLQLGNGSAIQQNGDTLSDVIEQSLMEKLENQLLPELESAVNHLNTVICQVECQLSDSGDLHYTLNSLSLTASKLNNISANIDRMMQADIPPIITDIHTICNNLSGVSHNISGIDFTRIDTCLAKANIILTQFNSCDNTIGLLLNDTTLHFNINRTVEDADQLLIDLKSHPKRYVHFSVFGNKKE